MLYQLKMDLKRGLLSWRFLGAILLCTTVYMLGALPEKGSGDILYILDASVAFSSFTELFPVAAVLPLGCSMLEDIKSGYSNFILQRATIRQYLTIRFLATAFLGALATALGMLLFLAILPISHPLILKMKMQDAEPVYEYMRDLVQKKQWGLYFGFYALLQGLSGMMWASVGMVISSIVNSAQLIYLSVVLSMEVICKILFSFNLPHVVVLAMGGIDEASRTAVFYKSGGIFILITMICFMGFYFLQNRRLRHV